MMTLAMIPSRQFAAQRVVTRLNGPISRTGDYRMEKVIAPNGKEIEVRYRRHPLSALFPDPLPEEFDTFVEDVATHGLRNKIVLAPDPGDSERLTILDGWLRYLACLLAGREPEFEECGSTSTPTELVISFQLRRRHLNESQRAALAAKLLPMAEQELSIEKVQQLPSAQKSSAILRKTRTAAK